MADPRCLTALHVGVALMSTLASQFLLPPKNPKSPRASRRASPASTGRISGLRNFWRVRAHVLSRFRRAKTRKLGSVRFLVGGRAERHGACFGCARVAICGLLRGKLRVGYVCYFCRATTRTRRTRTGPAPTDFAVLRVSRGHKRLAETCCNCERHISASVTAASPPYM